MRKIKSNIFSIDPLITGIYIILISVGFITIFSTQNKDDILFLSFSNESFKQLLWMLLSILVFFSIFFLEHRFIYNLAVPLYVFSILLLVLVLFVGDEIASSRSWFVLFGFKIQPSEFSKFTTALFIAKIFDSYNLN